MAAIIQNVFKFLSTLENSVLRSMGFFPPPVHIAPALTELSSIPIPSFNVKDLLQDSILWGVPTHRRTLEKRKTRRFGDQSGKYASKLQLPKTNILICKNCRGYHEANCLCPTCYERVKIETTEMQEEIEKSLGLNPVDKEVVVLFEGERNSESEELYEGKRIIEMKKERPAFFSKNLLQKSTQAPAETSEIKHDQLA